MSHTHTHCNRATRRQPARCTAAKFGLKAHLAAKGDNKSVPARDSWSLSADAKYVHYCDNETIGGERGAAGGVVAARGAGRWAPPVARGAACNAGIAAQALAAGRASSCRAATIMRVCPHHATAPLSRGGVQGRARRGCRRAAHRRHVLQLPVQAR
jgi:hypothetical protein